MKSLKKLSNTELANLYGRLDRVFIAHENLFYKKFEKFANIIRKEIDNRNYAEIYKTCCRVLKNRNFPNQFAAASHFAAAAMNEIFTSDRYYEIGGYYTKSGNPVEVDLVMFWEGR